MRIRLNGLRILSMVLAILVLLIAATPENALAQRSRTDRGKRVSKRTERVVTPKKKASAGKSATLRRRSGDRSANRATQSRSARGRSTPSMSSQDGATQSRSRLYIPSARIFPKPHRTYRATHAYRYYPKLRWYPQKTLRIRWPRIHLHISWPWVIRSRRHWAPHYRYRQVVYVQTRWGSRQRTSRVELETHFSHELRYADDQRAELDIFIEQIDIYYEGRYIGKVERVPESLGRVRATVYRDGGVHFDRDIFVLGDPFAGFELISTKHYNGFVMDQFRDSDGYRAGRLDLNRRRVSRISRSRLFNPFDASGYFPISVLPENEGWLWDFGADAMSAATDNYDTYYGYESDGRHETSSYGADPLRFESELSFRTQAGADVYLRRESQIQRVE
ncbi:MAG: hypothetical protein IIA50_06715 [Bacteroidetes bacterium]|nr:hypothetical protein [Bacteroidota bacterium]